VRARSVKPIDLKHLSEQSGGDRNLEIEVLTIFLEQSYNCVDAIERATNQVDRHYPAHMLKGAARTIGAFDLSNWASRAELPGFSDIDELKSELDRVSAYIRKLIRLPS
jgi:HPt (histidine-containing phosphotransfer) domain-containing protein